MLVGKLTLITMLLAEMSKFKRNGFEHIRVDRVHRRQNGSVGTIHLIMEGSSTRPNVGIRVRLKNSRRTGQLELRGWEWVLPMGNRAVFIKGTEIRHNKLFHAYEARTLVHSLIGYARTLNLNPVLPEQPSEDFQSMSGFMDAIQAQMASVVV